MFKRLLTFSFVISFFFVGCGEKKTETITIPVEGVPPPITGPIPQIPGAPIDPAFVGFDSFETQVLNDLTSIPDADRLFTRYLPLTAEFNEGSNLPAAQVALNKGINSLSTERDLELATAVGNQGIYRIDLRDFGITRSQWRFIESNDPFAFESFTDRGILIKQLTQARRPWINATNFMTIAHNDEVYYNTLDIPATLAEIQLNFAGVNLQAEFDNVDNDLFLVGLFDSPIALQKNRMLLRVDAREGPLWTTYDTIIEGQVSAPRNLFENPFPFEARSGRVFGHDAQEFIGTLPNGLQWYALGNAAGLRENFAPTNIVFDVNSGGLDPTIRNSLSCMRCHSKGVIAATDSVRASVIGNPDFNNADQQRAQAFFRPNGALQAVMRQDQERYAENLRRIGVDPDGDDPLNRLTDAFRREWDAKKVGAFFFLKEDELKTCIESSVRVRAQIGQLLRGEKVSVQQLIATAPKLIIDCNLFADDLGQ